MKSFREQIDALNLPDLMAGVTTKEGWEARREELIRLLSEYEYGVTPPAVPVTAEEGEHQTRFLANKADTWEARIRFDTPNGEFSFPVQVAIPKKNRPCPMVVFLNFRPEIPDLYLPAEELIDRGYGYARIYYNDVTYDNDDLSDGLAGKFDLDKRGADGMGKIGCWAYAASRTLDYLLTLDAVDPKRVAVCGHSRLGKTALWCGAQDTRFSAVFVNCSGAGGDAIFRDKDGETIGDLLNLFSYWFCPRFAEYRDREHEFPLDQHFLTALIAPRLLICVGAEDDTWADPVAELMASVEATKAYRLYGKEGIPCPEQMPKPDTRIIGDGQGFFHRPGIHFFSRSDWNFYLDCWEANLK